MTGTFKTMTVCVAGAVTVLLCTAPANATGPTSDVVASPVAFVANFFSNTVTPIRIASNTAAPAIQVGRNPNAVVVTPNGRTAYVTNSGASTVSPINTATQRTLTPIHVGRGPSAMVLTPDGSKLYVASADGTVTPVDTATNQAGPAIVVGSDPVALAVTPNGKRVFVSNLGSGSVTPIRTDTDTAGPAIPVGRAPGAITVAPDGKTAYVVNGNFADRTVRPINVSTSQAGQPIQVGFEPHAITITPDGRTAYVACYNANVPPGQPGAGSVWPINLATATAGRPIRFGAANPFTIVVNAASTTAYVTSGLGLTAIDVATNAVEGSAPAGDGPTAVVLTPDGSRAYVANFGTGHAPARSVIAIRLADLKVIKRIGVGVEPVAIAIAP